MKLYLITKKINNKMQPYLPVNTAKLSLIEASFTLSNQPHPNANNNMPNPFGGNAERYNITSNNTRIRVGILIENICKITDSIQSQGQLQHMCPCMGLIQGCKFCCQALLEVPQEIPALEQYLGDGQSESIAHFRETAYGDKKVEEEKKSEHQY